MSIKDGKLSVQSLDDNFVNLDLDITAIDIKISEIDQTLLDLKNVVNRTQVAIRNAGPGDKALLYKVITATTDTLSTYYQIYQRFLELKYKYRKEQDDLTFKTAHFIQIELKKIESSADSSYYDVIDMLKKLSNVGPTDDSKSVLPDSMQTELNDLDKNDNYSLE